MSEAAGTCVRGLFAKRSQFHATPIAAGVDKDTNKSRCRKLWQTLRALSRLGSVLRNEAKTYIAADPCLAPNVWFSVAARHQRSAAVGAIDNALFVLLFTPT